MDSEFIISVKNMLGDESAYHDDIFDLFGDPDGFNQGYIGNRKKKPIKWDWGQSGLKKVMKYIYYIGFKKIDHLEFEKWYRNEQINNFPYALKFLNRFLYIFKYKTKTIAAFFASVKSIEKKDRRIWFEFTPNRYFLLPPGFIDEYRNNFFSEGREDPDKWSKYSGIEENISNEIFSSAASQDQYHIIPNFFIHNWFFQYFESGGKPLFLSDVEDNNKRLKKGHRTNNQLFWDIFTDYIGKTQVKARFQLKYMGRIYEYTDIPINSIIDTGLVYLHEGGTPRIISEALKRIFKNQYIDLEFPDESYQKMLRDSLFIKRAVKVKDIYSKAKAIYSNTDFDYVLDLNPLGINVEIGFDLTCGLWHKGRATYSSKDEYVHQWEHNIFELPRRRKNFICIWHYGLLAKAESYKSKEIGKYLSSKHSETSILIDKKTDVKSINYNNYRSFILPFYKNEDKFLDITKELNNFEPLKGEVENTILFKLLIKLLFS